MQAVEEILKTLYFFNRKLSTFYRSGIENLLTRGQKVTDNENDYITD